MQIQNLNIAYIASMVSGGLMGFNYREIIEMRKLGANITFFITKYSTGPYMPPKGLSVYRTKPISIIASQPKRLIASPKKYVSLLVEAIRTNSIIDVIIAQKWSQFMKSEGCNWIHCHFGDHKFYIGYYCHKITNIPLSVTLHGYDLYKNPNWRMLEKALPACEQIITISENNKNTIRQKFGKIANQVKVIRLSADLPQNSKNESQIKNVLIVGGFHERKGYDILLKALHLLGRDDIHLWIIGYKGPVDVKSLIKQYDLEDSVTMFGHVSDEILKLLYEKCDIFALPSRVGSDGVGEGLPVALMEAMAYGKPVVTTHHSGIPELVPDILVKENDAQGLAEGIAKLADNPELRIETGKRNREIIKNDYSNENVKKLLESFTIDQGD